MYDMTFIYYLLSYMLKNDAFGDYTIKTIAECLDHE